jgi:hypothetical protein
MTAPGIQHRVLLINHDKSDSIDPRIFKATEWEAASIYGETAVAEKRVRGFRVFCEPASAAATKRVTEAD